MATKHLLRILLPLGVTLALYASAHTTTCPPGDYEAGHETITASNPLAKDDPDASLSSRLAQEPFEDPGPAPVAVRYIDGFWVSVNDWFQLDTDTITGGGYDIDVHFYGSYEDCDDDGCVDRFGWLGGASCTGTGGDESCAIPDGDGQKASDALIVASAGTGLDVRVCLS